MAAGAGLGYLHYETTSTSSDGSTDSKLVSENIDLMVPVFVSYHFNELIALYASPKWVMGWHLEQIVIPCNFWALAEV